MSTERSMHTIESWPTKLVDGAGLLNDYAYNGEDDKIFTVTIDEETFLQGCIVALNDTNPKDGDYQVMPGVTVNVRQGPLWDKE